MSLPQLLREEKDLKTRKIYFFNVKMSVIQKEIGNK